MTPNITLCELFVCAQHLWLTIDGSAVASCIRSITAGVRNVFEDFGSNGRPENRRNPAQNATLRTIASPF